MMIAKNMKMVAVALVFASGFVFAGEKVEVKAATPAAAVVAAPAAVEATKSVATAPKVVAPSTGYYASAKSSVTGAYSDAKNYYWNNASSKKDAALKVAGTVAAAYVAYSVVTAAVNAFAGSSDETEDNA